VVLASAGRGVFAQQSLSTGGDPMSDMPPALAMPGDEASSLPIGPGTEAEGDAALQPIPEEIAAGTEAEGFSNSLLGEPMRALAACPALFESTGTWLRRGYWYSEVDYMLLNRAWEKKGLVLGREERLENGGVGQPIAIAPYIVGNYINLRGHSPGGEGLARVNIGRFLFRDANNRDHLLEAGWLGGGQFREFASGTSPNANSTTVSTAATEVGWQVSDFIDGPNPSFDGSAFMSASYVAQVNTGELNYVVRSRLHRDRMLLEPNGQWVRAATPTRTYSWLAGIRYLSLNDTLNWIATDRTGTTTIAEGGFYDVRTTNQLFGAQLGGSIGYETARWSITATGKVAPCWNRMHLHSTFDLNRTTFVDGFTDSHEDTLAFVGEANLIARYHLRPNLSLRAGLEALTANTVAIAPHQVNFVPGGFPQIARSGDSTLLGTSFGIEAYW
jgi:hypothetical protein